MTTYSLRCRNSACRHRRVSERHPDDLRRRVRCVSCGGLHGWRVEGRAYNRRGLCHCSGPDAATGKHFPHRSTHPLCERHPQFRINQARHRGEPEAFALGLGYRTFGPVHDRVLTQERRGLQRTDSLPVGRLLGADEPCPF